MDFKGIDLGALHFPADLPALQVWAKKIGGPLIASLASLVRANDMAKRL
jgi:hypothetical protein